MTNEDPVMTIDKPHFTVKLYTDLLKVDLKDGIKRELEAFAESKPMLRESIGLLFQTIIPLDVRLKDISSVSLDNKGRVKVAIPTRRDITIPVEADEAQRLIKKLNELIPPEKERMARDKAAAKKVGMEGMRREAEAEKDLSRKMFQK
jgi:hypothetical protein